MGIPLRVHSWCDFFEVHVHILDTIVDLIGVANKNIGPSQMLAMVLERACWVMARLERRGGSIVVKMLEVVHGVAAVHIILKQGNDLPNFSFFHPFCPLNKFVERVDNKIFISYFYIHKSKIKMYS